LRHKECVSNLRDMSGGTSFHRILWDHAQAEPDDYSPLQADGDIKRLVLCSGKVYYDLLAERNKRKLDNVYLMRIEQLFPFPSRRLAKEMARFPGAKIIWCQEEPKNMGAWSFIAPLIEESLTKAGRDGDRPSYAGRPAAASPATGQMKRHINNQRKLVQKALYG